MGSSRASTAHSLPAATCSHCGCSVAKDALASPISPTLSPYASYTPLWSTLLVGASQRSWLSPSGSIQPSPAFVSNAPGAAGTSSAGASTSALALALSPANGTFCIASPLPVSSSAVATSPRAGCINDNVSSSRGVSLAAAGAGTKNCIPLGGIIAPPTGAALGMNALMPPNGATGAADVIPSLANTSTYLDRVPVAGLPPPPAPTGGTFDPALTGEPSPPLPYASYRTGITGGALSPAVASAVAFAGAFLSTHALSVSS
mmetsp:Transcript_5105/g.16881  ORF Transcript_5105/g.16881 Transcript_5105/m.16881 type:complete len:260 (+) Transcript_5105:1069-1848(+)